MISCSDVKQDQAFETIFSRPRLRLRPYVQGQDQNFGLHMSQGQNLGNVALFSVSLPSRNFISDYIVATVKYLYRMIRYNAVRFMRSKAGKATSVYHMVHTHTHTHTHTHPQPFYGSMEFVRDNPGELMPEETFTHLHLSWSPIVPYLLHPSITIHGILPVQSGYAPDSLFPQSLLSFLWSASWPGTIHSILHTFLHPIIVFFSQHMPIPSQSVLL